MAVGVRIGRRITNVVYTVAIAVHLGVSHAWAAIVPVDNPITVIVPGIVIVITGVADAIAVTVDIVIAGITGIADAVAVFSFQPLCKSRRLACRYIKVGYRKAARRTVCLCFHHRYRTIRVQRRITSVADAVAITVDIVIAEITGIADAVTITVGPVKECQDSGCPISITARSG